MNLNTGKAHPADESNEEKMSAGEETLKVPILDDCIGRNLICEDGKSRRVHSIVQSFAFKTKCVINEEDPDSDSGYFIHHLSLAAQMHGTPMPTPAQIAAFDRMVAALDWTSFENRREKRLYQQRNGIVIPKMSWWDKINRRRT